MSIRSKLLMSLLALVAGSSLSLIANELNRSEIEELVVAQLKSWETTDEASFLETLHDDVVFAYPGKRLNREESLEIFRFWKEKFRDTKVYIHKILIEENSFSVEYQFATTKISNEMRSVSGTVTVGTIVDGKIRLWKEYLDGRVSRMQEAGELPLDEGEEPYPWPHVEDEE